MSPGPLLPDIRILVVDDYEPIHRDFQKILQREFGTDELAAAQAALFGTAPVSSDRGAASYRLDFASQGERALEMVRQACAAGLPYALAFVDMRMPPGWDGFRTIMELWRAAPDLHVVLCTAYSDVSLREVARDLGRADRLLILKKPFDAIEVEQLAASLTAKWRLVRDEAQRVEELARARAQAAAADAKSQFLAHVSHEIRTPMTAILGYAEVLRDEDLPREQQLGYLESICRSGAHLLGVVSNILDVSKLEAGRVELETLPFSPADLLADTVVMLRGGAEARGLRLEAETDASLPPSLLGDPTRLRQIFVNLVGNAVKFTSAGRVVVRARANAAPAGGGGIGLEIDVEDTGPGIAPDVLSNLFTVFSQGDVSTTRRFGGTGLGLAISRRLARAMGGDIAVRSELGRGTCFTVTVLLQPPAAQPPAPALPAAAPPATRMGAVRLDARVLLVDDARDNQLLFSLLLRRAGAQVSVVGDGEAALSAWSAAADTDAPFDLIVTDMQMPLLDGYELARTLRARACRAPVLALTAHASAEDQRRCLEAGCDEYLSKPVDSAALIACCRRLLDAKAGSKPAAR